MQHDILVLVESGSKGNACIEPGVSIKKPSELKKGLSQSGTMDSSKQLLKDVNGRLSFPIASSSSPQHGNSTGRLSFPGVTNASIKMVCDEQISTVYFDEHAAGMDVLFVPDSPITSEQDISGRRVYADSSIRVVDPNIDPDPGISLVHLPQPITTYASALTLDKLHVVTNLKPSTAEPSSVVQRSVKLLQKLWGDSVDEESDNEWPSDHFYSPSGNKFVASKDHKKKNKQKQHGPPMRQASPPAPKRIKLTTFHHNFTVLEYQRLGKLCHSK